MDLGGDLTFGLISQAASCSEESLTDFTETGDLVLPTKELVSQVKGLEGLKKRLPDLSKLDSLRPQASRKQRIAQEEEAQLARITEENLIQEQARAQAQIEKDAFDARVAEQEAK